MKGKLFAAALLGLGVLSGQGISGHPPVGIVIGGIAVLMQVAEFFNAVFIRRALQGRVPGHPEMIGFRIPDGFQVQIMTHGVNER